MSIGKKTKRGNRNYTFRDIPKIKKMSIFFKYGFYVALVIWICEFIFVMFYKESEVIKIIVTAISLSIYSFFVIGKFIVEKRLRK